MFHIQRAKYDQRHIKQEEIARQNPAGSTHERVNKYSLIFGRETKEEVDENIKLSKEPLPPLDSSRLESSVEDFAVGSLDLGMPKRGK